MQLTVEHADGIPMLLVAGDQQNVWPFQMTISLS
jgi:hypothetical protein